MAEQLRDSRERRGLLPCLGVSLENGLDQTFLSRAATPPRCHLSVTLLIVQRRFWYRFLLFQAGKREAAQPWRCSGFRSGAILLKRACAWGESTLFQQWRPVTGMFGQGLQVQASYPGDRGARSSRAGGRGEAIAGARTGMACQEQIADTLPYLWSRLRQAARSCCASEGTTHRHRVIDAQHTLGSTPCLGHPAHWRRDRALAGRRGHGLAHLREEASA